MSGEFLSLVTVAGNNTNNNSNQRHHCTALQEGRKEGEWGRTKKLDCCNNKTYPKTAWTAKRAGGKRVATRVHGGSDKWPVTALLPP